MTFSVINPKRIHQSIHKEADNGNHEGPTISGRRWKKTSPSNAQAEKLTIHKMICLSKDMRIHNVIIPIKEIRLTIITLTIA
ncbi:MAG: hypothetical protein WCJ45_03470 [bacterium]